MLISVRDAMLPLTAPSNCFDELRQLGVTSLEAWLDKDMTLPHLWQPDGTPYSLKTPEAIAATGTRLEAEGMTIAALCLATDFSGEDAAAHVDWAVQATCAAYELGVPAVRIDTATRNTNLSTEQVRDNFIQRVSQVLQQTSATGVELGIENHGHISNDPEFLHHIFGAVADDRLGMTLDPGNFYWYGFPRAEVYQIVQRFAPLTKHTHIKNIKFPQHMVETRREVGYEYAQFCAPIAEGDLDWRHIVHTLRAAGYNHNLCIEDESLGKVEPERRLEVLREDCDAVRQTLT